MAEHENSAAKTRLLRPVDTRRDHRRGGMARTGVITLVVYGDYLCPYCRRLRLIVAQLREVLGERLAYVFRHFPNETAHPGATQIAGMTEAAARQGKFWEMHDWLYDQEPPLDAAMIEAQAREIGLDMDRFATDLASPGIEARVRQDLDDGRLNGVTGTPSFFIDGLRYDGAWDFHSMLEAIELPVASRVQRSARAFANLRASGGLALLLAAMAALVAANSPLAPQYQAFIHAIFGIGPPGGLLSMSVEAWFSEGLLAVFFLLVGLEIRREMSTGDLSEPRAAALPVLAAVGGALAPALIYLALNNGPQRTGWSVPTATDVAFTLGILALLGRRVPATLRVFVAALAVADDVISVLTLAIFYPKNFTPEWLLPAAVAVLVLFLLNRSRVYAAWPYVVVTGGLWFSLHAAGVHGALAGILLAGFLPTRPAPSVGPLLAQAATALAALEEAESEAKASGLDATRIAQEPIWDWASRNLSAASDRLLSPADRIERAVSPWSSYVILPLFAFSATGVSFDLDLSDPGAGRIMLGVVLGLVVGKPLGILVAAALAIRSRLAVGPTGVPVRAFVGAACLCGVGDTMAMLLADQAFADEASVAIAKIAVLIGSVLAAALGAAIIVTSRPVATGTPATPG
ncbi:MAG: Na+/H+ antiporter NhaA [Cypionkella sp.]